MKRKITPILFVVVFRLVMSEEADLGIVSDSLNISVKESVISSILEDWHFQCGDAIKIIAIPDTGFPNGIYPIDGEGYVDLPMIGPLQLKTMSKSECEKKLREAYIPLLRFSSIQVRRVISISFQGGFRNPGMYWVSPGATMWYTLSLSGGTLREDGLKRIRWERDGKIMKQTITELLKTDKPIAQHGLKSGDIIRVINRPIRSGWDVFRQDVLPIFNVGLSGIVTAITLYEIYHRR